LPVRLPNGLLERTRFARVGMASTASGMGPGALPLEPDSALPNSISVVRAVDPAKAGDTVVNAFQPSRRVRRLW
jgi:hypothetical protein